MNFKMKVMEIIQNKNWSELAAKYDWVADMHNVQQDNIHHAEGDVAIHTQMVLHELINLKEYQDLDVIAKEIIWTAALLHDVEKRSTTIMEENGSISSPNHAKKGALTARQILFTEFNISFNSREQIVGLVRFHGLPLWLMHKPNPLKTLLDTSFKVNTEWLCILAKADMLGRICNDKNEMLERIDFFEAYCKEQNCFGIARKFETNAAKFNYFYKENVSANYVPYEDCCCEVILMSGLPGMGKDTYIQKHDKDYPIISLDEIRRRNKLKPEDTSANGWVAQQAKEQAKIYLRAKQNFMWNATNITSQMRAQLIDLFASYGAYIKIVYIEKPYKIWQNQNTKREEMVPKAVLQKMLYKLEVPTLTEAHEVAFLVD